MDNITFEIHLDDKAQAVIKEIGKDYGLKGDLMTVTQSLVKNGLTILATLQAEIQNGSKIVVYRADGKAVEWKPKMPQQS